MRPLWRILSVFPFRHPKASLETPMGIAPFLSELSWRRVKGRVMNRFKFYMASIAMFLVVVFVSGCAVTTTESGHTYVGFSLLWFLFCVFTGPIGITINIIYVICKLSGCC